MKNKRMEIARLKDRLFRHDALDQFGKAWAQVERTGRWAVQANGGWIFGKVL